MARVPDAIGEHGGTEAVRQRQPAVGAGRGVGSSRLNAVAGNVPQCSTPALVAAGAAYGQYRRGQNRGGEPPAQCRRWIHMVPALSACHLESVHSSKRFAVRKTTPTIPCQRMAYCLLHRVKRSWRFAMGCSAHRLARSPQPNPRKKVPDSPPRRLHFLAPPFRGAGASSSVHPRSGEQSRSSLHAT